MTTSAPISNQPSPNTVSSYRTVPGASPPRTYAREPLTNTRKTKQRPGEDHTTPTPEGGHAVAPATRRTS